MRMRARLFALFALLALPASLAAQQAAAPRFPHDKHARLFLNCSSCHAGISTGDLARSFPAPALCANCHNGTIKPRVDWTAPASTSAGLLVFSHPVHLAKAKDVTCETCHAVADTGQW